MPDIPESWTRTTCPYCGVGCGILANPGGELLVAIGSSAAKLTRGEQIGDPALQALGQ